MALISKPNTFINGTIADASAVNADFDTIYNDYNGNITDTNIANTGITTYGKVQGAALASLAGINPGAGIIPTANLPAGATVTIATQAEAEAASDNTVVMTPLRVKQEIAVTGNLPIIPITKGGTGASTKQEAIDAILPSQTGKGGSVLTTDGTNSSWGGSNFPSYTDGTYLEGSIAATLYTHPSGTGTTPLLAKQLTPLRRGGTFSVAVDIAAEAGGAGRTAYARVYINNTPYGSAQSTLSSYSTFATLTFTGVTASIGDSVQIYIWASNVNYSYAKNMRILCANPSIPIEVY